MDNVKWTMINDWPKTYGMTAPDGNLGTVTKTPGKDGGRWWIAKVHRNSVVTECGKMMIFSNAKGLAERELGLVTTNTRTLDDLGK